MLNDDGTIDLRTKDDEPEFRIGEIEPDSSEQDVVGELVSSDSEDLISRPSDKVKVKFDKFVNLIATHAYEDVINKHLDQDVVISTDLLTDLANAHEEKQDKKMPMIFLVGILLGIIFTWILLKT